MRKLIGLVFIVLMVYIVFQYAANMFDSVAGPSRASQGTENAQGSLVPVRPLIESACTAHGCSIVQYAEPEKYFVELTVRGPDRNSVSAWLDDLTWPEDDLVKDIDLNKAKYWQGIENGNQVFYASYRLRAYK